MHESAAAKVVRPLAKGQITIPIAIRRALGITESSLLEIRMEANRIVISKLEPEGAFRVYSDQEIADFLEEDKITPEIAGRVRDLMRAGLV